MPVLDKNYLQSLGINVTDEEFVALDEHIQDELGDRVITEILSFLTVEQAQELAALKGQGDDGAIQIWLQENVKDLDDIVRDEVDILLSELVQDNNTISS